MGVLAANNRFHAMDIFVKVLVGVVAETYFFGGLWFSDIWYGIVFVGLCFRFTFVITGETRKWKIAAAFLAYFVAFVDRISDIGLGANSQVESPCLTLLFFMVALISAFLVDLRQYLRVIDKVNNKDWGEQGPGSGLEL